MFAAAGMIDLIIQLILKNFYTVAIDSLSPCCLCNRNVAALGLNVQRTFDGRFRFSLTDLCSSGLGNQHSNCVFFLKHTATVFGLRFMWFCQALVPGCG